MIHTQTILVPSLFDESKVLRLNEERIEDLARSAKQRLNDALSKGWRITHFTAFTYESVEYFHYVLERQTEDVTYPKQLVMLYRKCIR